MISIIKLCFIFIKELYLANVSVMKSVLSPKLNIRPGIFAFKTELTKDWEITMLSLLITLTPGTLVMDISDDRTILYIHAMDIEDAEKAIFDIRESFEKSHTGGEPVMFTLILQIALGIMAVSTFLYVIRVIKGPTVPDRVVALDAIGINLIAITALVSILLKTSAFLDIILLLGILSFIGTIAFSKFLEKGEIIENDRNR